MVDDSALRRVFVIGELARLIASQLVLIGRESAVNLACTCRYLEEIVLSELWETQSSLDTLLGVLPRETWIRENLGEGESVFRIVGDPSPEAWNRVRRYASWMREVNVEGWSALGENTIHKLRLNSPAGGWFPMLQDLDWCIRRSNLPYADLFFSPRLEKIYLSVSWCAKLLHDALPAIASAIFALPTSNLQLLYVDDNHRNALWAHFKESFSSFALRCGPSLVEFIPNVSLSDAAINHLIQLPHLHTWRVDDPPPNYSASSLPSVFPPLTDFTLGEGAACGWLSLFERLENQSPVTEGVAPLFRVKKSLEILNIEGYLGPIIDVSFTSPIKMFRNLVYLNIGVYCYVGDNEGECTFKLDNGNVTSLAMELSQLKTLLLGHACFENTCLTTVACLLQISVHCIRLKYLEIHFNTTNIVEDLKNMPGDPQLQGLRASPRCMVTCLQAYRMPLTLDERGLETVANGMVDIFPSLERCEGFEGTWKKLSERIRGVNTHGEVRIQ